MIVSQMIQKIKRFFLRRDVYATLVVVLVGVSAFGLGRLSVSTSDHAGVNIKQAFSGISIATSSSKDREAGQLVVPAQEGTYVGSRNSDKYHYPWCPGAQRIKEENKVWFASVEEAREAGYTPAANCEGL